ncbi:DUF3823 domain-containing protein [Mucilaginibacter limnophilus]|uniref:DUF3823 domain-containing protein n=1 Tax=Mucilaginibacter limnophilus TaxID=1932778 RepID=A0A437MZ12_9SPHI|nr:DUF3823 domain-containing protein [Mucilaginibacter limnophilus]RVU02905.1 DUF3823 domain-containing protein [Mucilaginibacter limnophilus]
MNKLKYIFYIAVIALASCKLDNYEKPTGSLSGKFIDEETGELVQQEISLGTMVELREHGYNPVTPQNIIVQPDGTYKNTQLFQAKYSVVPTKGNFMPIDTQVVDVKSSTELDFKVTPFLRIKDINITKQNGKVVAKFKVEQVYTGAPILAIGLFANKFPMAGRYSALVFTETIYPPSSQEYTMELDIAGNSSILKAGQPYYFRIGAIIDVPEAKYNYTTAVRITL